ncbi:MAG: exonuclease SbcCD subunit D [Thermoplasmatales archaeon]|nr:MAG: exonuclease SbcCD subunit D [Thermoplasmatales archaeon]
MKILHVADTHLGFSAYRKLTEDGKNQREVDVYDAFNQCVDYAVKSKPDLVLHAGDLFDSVRPTNRAITVAIQQILRLSQEKIPFVVISGNHETPKLKETGNILTIFEHLDFVYPIYNNGYETISFEIDDKKITIHAISQCGTKKDFNDNLKEVDIDSSSDFNIFMAHGAVTGIKEFKMNEFNELFIPTNTFAKNFDYIALGHYHKYTELRKNAFYSGSTENLTFSDIGGKKGFLEIEPDKKMRHTFIEVNTRPMIDAPCIDCSNLSIEEVVKNIKDTIRKIEPKGKIFRIRLVNIPSHIYRGIDFNQIRDLSKGSVHFEIKSDVLKEEESQISENYKIESIAGEFEKYLRKQQLPDKEVLLKLGLEYIQKVESKDEGK